MACLSIFSHHSLSRWVDSPASWRDKLRVTSVRLWSQIPREKYLPAADGLGSWHNNKAEGRREGWRVGTESKMVKLQHYLQRERGECRKTCQEKGVFVKDWQATETANSMWGSSAKAKIAVYFRGPRPDVDFPVFSWQLATFGDCHWTACAPKMDKLCTSHSPSTAFTQPYVCALPTWSM